MQEDVIELPPGELYPVQHVRQRAWWPRVDNKPVGSPATIWRDVLRGKRGSRLPTLKLGGKRFTTDQWAITYYSRLSAPEAPTAAAPSDTPARRERRAAQAAKELEADGI